MQAEVAGVADVAPKGLGPLEQVRVRVGPINRADEALLEDFFFGLEVEEVGSGVSVNGGLGFHGGPGFHAEALLGRLLAFVRMSMCVVCVQVNK